jgi:hypothetical protein
MMSSLKESRVAAEMAKVPYDFLPGSGARQWKGHVNFQSVAQEVGVGAFWPAGSKEPAIAALLEKTLESKRELFEPLILGIVKAGIRYREKNGNPIQRAEIEKLNGLILDVDFKFPSLWDPAFLANLGTDSLDRATQNVELARKQEQLREKKQVTKLAQLDSLRSTFYELSGQADRQAAGLGLERILNELFSLSGLAPRTSFRVVGEQIDGSFELDNEIYLVEAKWEAQPLSEAPLLVFRGKIEGKSQFTRGLFISLEGVSQPALDAITRGKQANFFLMDGYDLSTVLEGQIPLDVLLRSKLRRLLEEGKIFVRVTESP